MPTTARFAPRKTDLIALLNAARPKLHGLLVFFNVPVEDADDVLHDSFVALLDQWYNMDGVTNPEGWLLGTLRLTILQYWRRRGRKARFLERLSRVAPTSEPARQESEDAARDLAALTAHLPQRDILILWLRYGLGQKPREVAQALGCQPDSVRKLTRRALERVRRQLAAAQRPHSSRPAAPAARTQQLIERRAEPADARTTRPCEAPDPIGLLRPVQVAPERSAETGRGATSDRAVDPLTTPVKARHRP